MNLLRCPECKMAILSNASIVVREEKRTRMNLPLKICRRCKIMLLCEKSKLAKWKIWNGEHYCDLHDPSA